MIFFNLPAGIQQMGMCKSAISPSSTIHLHKQRNLIITVYIKYGTFNKFINLIQLGQG